MANAVAFSQIAKALGYPGPGSKGRHGTSSWNLGLAADLAGMGANDLVRIAQEGQQQRLRPRQMALQERAQSTKEQYLPWQHIINPTEDRRAKFSLAQSDRDMRKAFKEGDWARQDMTTMERINQGIRQMAESRAKRANELAIAKMRNEAYKKRTELLGQGGKGEQEKTVNVFKYFPKEVWQPMVMRKEAELRRQAPDTPGLRAVATAYVQEELRRLLPQAQAKQAQQAQAPPNQGLVMQPYSEGESTGPSAWERSKAAFKRNLGGIAPSIRDMGWGAVFANPLVQSAYLAPALIQKMLDAYDEAPDFDERSERMRNAMRNSF